MLSRGSSTIRPTPGTGRRKAISASDDLGERVGDAAERVRDAEHGAERKGLAHLLQIETTNRYSLEKMGDLLGQADIIISFDYGTLKDQEANRVFRALPAVMNGNYVALPTEVATACRRSRP